MNNPMTNLPHTPGVYLMRSYSGEILYIGKANDLQKRVLSYFSKRQQDPRISTMFSGVRVIDYVILKSERDALLFENRLIKHFQPKYNVALRDDKSYPYIKVTLNERFPRICLARKTKLKKGVGNNGRYFGPYHNAGEVKRLLRWLRVSFKICPCKKDVEKMTGCLYQDIDFCPAPCKGKISRNDYLKNVNKVIMFLEGNFQPLRKTIEKEMTAAGKKLNFERAAQLRKNILAIDNMFQKVSLREINETELTSKLETSRALSALKERLNLVAVPLVIEAIDVSNISGTNPTGSTVRFTNGLPDKQNYRMYRIKTLNEREIDDYKMVYEIVNRRYRRLRDEKKPLPDLILIDGGKGQLSAAKKAIENLGIKNVSIASLAKKEEEVFLPSNETPVAIAPDNPALLLLKHIRDEAHRFALKYHQLKRSKFIKAVLIFIALSLFATTAMARQGKIILKNGNSICGNLEINKDKTITVFFKNGYMKITKDEICRIIFTSKVVNTKKKWSDTNTEYDDAIIKCARENNISPALVKAVVHTESGFYPNCISRKNAKGLMQLAPENIESFCLEDPFNPWHNISVGTRYLKLQLDRFGGDLDKALASYNAGPNAVIKYDGIPPYEETVNFVRTVKKLYKKYLELWKSKGRVHSFSDEKGRLYFYNE
ncbi:MAG: transglycosylase SLT domain-containing protein [Elusimicrobiota bacterium]